MNILVVRWNLTDKSSIGNLSIDGVPYCHTLEPPIEGDPCAIPEGTYDISIRYSDKHKRLLPAVNNVPGRTDIEIHPGNKPEDTLGCLLLGSTIGPEPDWIGHSVDAFDPFFLRIQGAIENAQEPVYITYKNAAGAAQGATQ